MTNLVVQVLIMIFIYIFPIVGIYLILNEILQSRSSGKDLDNIANGIRTNLDVLRAGDIATFDGLFSNWLEKEIMNVESLWAKTSLRLMIQAKVIGLGEEHREKLSKDVGYRRDAIRFTNIIADGYEKGDNKQVVIQIGNLFALFLCQGASSSDSLDSTGEASDCLMKSSKLLRNGFVEADYLISSVIKKISQKGDPHKSGMPLLVLHWAKLRLKYRKDSSTRKIRIIPEHLQIMHQFQHLAGHLQSENTWGIYNVISKSH